MVKVFSSGDTAVVSCYRRCISCPEAATDYYYMVSLTKSYPVNTGPNFIRLEICPPWLLPLFYLSSSSRRCFAAIALYRVDAWVRLLKLTCPLRSSPLQSADTCFWQLAELSFIEVTEFN